MNINNLNTRKKGGTKEYVFHKTKSGIIHRLKIWHYILREWHSWYKTKRRKTKRETQVQPYINIVFVCFWHNSPWWARASPFTRFLDHKWHTTVGRTPLNEWAVCRRDLYLTTHNTHNRQTSMPPVGFEPPISAGEWPQTYALDRVATGTAI